MFKTKFLLFLKDFFLPVPKRSNSGPCFSFHVFFIFCWDAFRIRHTLFRDRGYLSQY